MERTTFNFPTRPYSYPFVTPRLLASILDRLELVCEVPFRDATRFDRALHEAHAVSVNRTLVIIAIVLLEHIGIDSQNNENDRNDNDDQDDCVRSAKAR